MSFLFANKRKRGLRLIEAVKKGETAKTLELLEKDIEIDAIDENGDTALMWAVLKGNKEVLLTLLSHQPPPNWDHKNKNGFTPLMFAAGKGHAEIVKILLDLKDPPIDIHHKNKVGQTALDYAKKNGFAHIDEMIRSQMGGGAEGRNGSISASPGGFDLADALRDPNINKTQPSHNPPPVPAAALAQPPPVPADAQGAEHDGGSTSLVQKGPNTDEPSINLDAPLVAPRTPVASPSDRSDGSDRDHKRGRGSGRHEAQHVNGSGKYKAKPRAGRQSSSARDPQHSPNPQRRKPHRDRAKSPRHDRNGDGERKPRKTKRRPEPFEEKGADSSLEMLKDSSLTLEKTQQNKLGEGGCGIVWKGEYLMMPVAVKELKGCASLSAKKDFMDEIRLQSRLKYPRIINVIGVLVQNEDLLLITEYCPLKSMCDVFHGKLRPQLIKNWNIRKRMAIEAAQGLAYLHDRNILHLDIKPLNLMVDEDLHIKVGDFGISKFLSTEQTVKAKGWTPTYVSPEVMTGKPFGKPADVYSFAIVLYEIFTMWDPYCDANCNAQVLLTKIAMGTRPTVPDALPKAQRDLLTKAWHPDPDERPSFIQLLEELRKL